MICAERLGLTGTGGGGTGDSRVRSALWSWLRVASSSFRAREEEVVEMALEVGSMRIGSWVKVSRSSIMVILLCSRGDFCFSPFVEISDGLVDLSKLDQIFLLDFSGLKMCGS